MSLDADFKLAAKAAAQAVRGVMGKYRDDLVHDEDDITGRLAGRLDGALDGVIGGLDWSCRQVRHRRGKAAEESEYGADLLIHVRLLTDDLSYSKGVLIQSKRSDGKDLNRQARKNLNDQCDKMLDLTSEAFVFDYGKGGMRCGPAARIRGSQRKDIRTDCIWTPYRFFLELFRCPAGDPAITSAKYGQSVPWVVELKAKLASQVILDSGG